MPSKSSSVDFIPTSLLKLCPSVFSELIARLANLSFSEDTFPAKFKAAAVITPLLKKPSLDPDNPSSYCPISNLNISKIIERLFLSLLYPHVTSSPTLTLPLCCVHLISPFWGSRVPTHPLESELSVSAHLAFGSSVHSQFDFPLHQGHRVKIRAPGQSGHGPSHIEPVTGPIYIFS